MWNFGHYLNKVRKGVMTQRELARKAGVGFPYISKIENNIEPPPSEEVLIKLAQILDVDSDEMFIHAQKIPLDLKEYLLKYPKLLKLLRNIKEDDLTRFLVEHFEELIKDKENAYLNFFDNNEKTMLLIDPDTSEIVNANNAAARFYNYPVKHLKTMRITDINTLSKEEIFEEMQRAKLELRNRFNFKHRLNHEKVLDVGVNSSPIIIRGKVYLHSVIYHEKIS
jgi:transcriptional regulator with XRE-family HTH domain